MTMDCPTPDRLLDAMRAADPALQAHLRACAGCRALLESRVAAGRCLSETALLRAIREGADDASAAHLSTCSACRSDAASLVEALHAEPGAAPDHLRMRVLEIGTKRTTARIPRRATLRRPAEDRRLAWGFGVAAASLVAVLLVFSLRTETESTARKPTPSKKEDRVVVREEPRPVPAPEPRRELPKVAVEPRKETPPPVPEPKIEPRKEEPPAVVPVPKEEPRPAPPPRKEEPKVAIEPKKSDVEPLRYRLVVVSAVYGPISKKSGEKLAAGSSLSRTETIVAGARQPARLTVAKDFSVALEKGGALQAEELEGGDTKLTLSGTAFFEVDKRTAPFVIRTPHADVIVVGTSFQVDVEEKRTTLHVLEGTVRFKNEKGEALVKASQRSTARAGEKPSTPVKADVDAETAWRNRPDLSGNPAKEPFLEHSSGGNRKLPGLVLESPYSETESDSGRLARATADLMDAGLALGHFHRSRERKIWVNIDRGTEGEFSADGKLGAAVATDRAKKTTADYLAHLKAAAGVAADRPIPMVVNVREHSESQDGAELEVCEVAWAGWNPKVMEQLKAFYAQLLEKHKPAYRVEMRFDRLDDTYDYKGKKRKFLFTEGDAKADGYMAPRHAQTAIAFFFNPSFGNRPEDVEVYARILSEMIEFLYTRRR